MERKLLLTGLVCYSIIIAACFMLIPKESMMFGMGMIPGPFGLFSTIGCPIIASVGIGIAVFRKSIANKGVNTTFFLMGSIIIWLLFILLT